MLERIFSAEISSDGRSVDARASVRKIFRKLRVQRRNHCLIARWNSDVDAWQTAARTGTACLQASADSIPSADRRIGRPATRFAFAWIGFYRSALSERLSDRAASRSPRWIGRARQNEKRPMWTTTESVCSDLTRSHWFLGYSISSLRFHAATSFTVRARTPAADKRSRAFDRRETAIREAFQRRETTTARTAETSGETFERRAFTDPWSSATDETCQKSRPSIGTGYERVQSEGPTNSSDEG